VGLIPVHVITGYLGSGKTTLLNATLRGHLGHGSAVVVNEFGDVGLDGTILQAAAEEIVELASGCLCCTMRTDLRETLMCLLRRDPHRTPLRRVLVETSGTSDPLPILQTLRGDFALRTRFRPGAVICTVDAWLPAIDARSSRESLAQISTADAYAITKQDLAGARAARALARRLGTINPLAPRIPARARGLTEFIEAHEAHGGYLPNHVTEAMAPSVRNATHALHSVVVRGPAPHSWPRFALWLTRLLHLHGERVLRTKGILYDRTQATWLAVNGVRRLLHPPTHLSLEAPPPWGTSIVFITEGLDPGLIVASYRREFGEASAHGSAPDAPASDIPGTMHEPSGRLTTTRPATQHAGRASRVH